MRDLLRIISVVFSLSVLCLGCTSKTRREIMTERQEQARPRAATFGTDGFYNDSKAPKEREPRQLDFFYKHCTLGGRNPYPSASDWECSEPQ